MMAARSVLILGSLLFGATTASSSTGSKCNPIENLFQPIQNESRNFQIPHGPHPNAPTKEELEKERQARRERNRQRRATYGDWCAKINARERIAPVDVENKNSIAYLKSYIR